MKSFLYIFALTAILIPLSSGFSAAMKNDDVIYGKDNVTPQMCLSQWDSEINEIFTRHYVTHEKRNEVEELLKSYRLKTDNKSIKEAYCRFGYIGNDLYFVIRSRQKQQQGYSYSDVFLAGNVKPKPEKQKPERQKAVSNKKKAENPVKTVQSDKPEKRVKTANHEKKENINKTEKRAPAARLKTDFKSYRVITASDLPSNIRNIIDIGNGYSIRITVLITGDELTHTQKNEIEKALPVVEENIRNEMLEIIIRLAEDVFSFRDSAEMIKINSILDEKDKDLKSIADEYSVNRRVENAVHDILSKTDHEPGKNSDWTVKCTVKSDASTLKLTKSGRILCLTGGSDSASYMAMADNVKNISSVISELKAEEPALRKEADKFIADFIKNSNVITGTVEEIYTSNKHDEKDKIKKIIDNAVAGETAVQDRFVIYLRLKILGYTTADPGNRIRLQRYINYLADTKARLTDELSKLIHEEQKFKNSMIKKTTKSLPELQIIKKNCGIVMKTLSENENYYKQADEKMIELTIKVSEDTTLSELKTIRSEVNQKKIINDSPRISKAVTKASDDIKSCLVKINDISSVLNQE